MIEPLRKELKRRGWTENPSEIPNLIWLSRSKPVVIEGSPFVNSLIQPPLNNFCYKDILIDYGRKINNRNHDLEPKLNLPRTFKLFTNERNDFIENYCLTAYSSFIRFVRATGSEAFSVTGKINSNWINFAIEKLDDLRQSKHQKNYRGFSKFSQIYRCVVKRNAKITANSQAAEDLLQQCHVAYEKCKKVWKDLDKDGFHNLWLLKPARRSLGIGIEFFDDKNIFNDDKDYGKMKYLAQKYVGE